MKTMITSLLTIFLFSFSVTGLAKILAQPGSTQIVIIMNDLANHLNADTEVNTQSAITFTLYQGNTPNDPNAVACWNPDPIAYHNQNVNTMVVGAGSNNGCATAGNNKYQGIVKVHIVPGKTNDNSIQYDTTPIDVAIDPKMFYTAILIEQDRAPTHDQNGNITKGTVKVEIIPKGQTNLTHSGQ